MSSNTSSSVGNAGRLRRSSRAPKKQTPEFSVGDLVEVSRTLPVHGLIHHMVGCTFDTNRL